MRLSSNLTSAALAASAVMSACALLPIIGPPDGDFALFLFPWMKVIYSTGWPSIAGGFSEYSPPYIYVLNLASWIHDPVAAVKLANVPFVILLACGVGVLAGRTGGFVALILPSLQVNSFAFGQADVVFTAFLLWFVVFAERNRMALAAVSFGLAFAFKAQAMFLSPVVLWLLLAGRMRLAHVALIPFTYLASMVPAAAAGRPWVDLLTIYLQQAGLMRQLSLNAPNPWWFVHTMDYGTGLVIGLTAGVGCAVGLALWAWRWNAPVLWVAVLSAAVLPYVLPKMTSRYFFVADVLTLVLAFREPRTWVAAVLIQIGSMIAMLSYFTDVGTAALAFLPTTMGIGFLLYYFWADVGESGDSPQQRKAGQAVKYLD